MVDKNNLLKTLKKEELPMKKHIPFQSSLQEELSKYSGHQKLDRVIR